MTRITIPSLLILGLGNYAVTLTAKEAGEVSGGRVKVFILAGQSNMEGKAAASTLYLYKLKGGSTVKVSTNDSADYRYPPYRSNTEVGSPRDGSDQHA